ncbi:MAG TPA: hypothetical protein VGF59_16870, partial [Bryobacteraceae bacterium]
MLLVQVTSLIATAGIVWIGTIGARGGRQTLSSILEQAFGYALLACFWSAAIAFGLLMLTPAEDRGDVWRSTLRTSAAAVWFAPAILLLSRPSPATAVAAFILVMSATRVLYSEYRALSPTPQLLEAHSPAFVISTCLQFGVAALLLRYRMTGVALLVMTTSLATVYSMATGAVEPSRPPALPRSILGLILTILLAAGLTVGGSWKVLMRGVGADSDWGLGGSGLAKKDTGAKFSRGTGDGDSAVRKQMPLNGDFPGVILLSEVKPVTQLVAPLVLTDQGLRGAARQPLNIVFDGEYDFFRFPFRRPPIGSYTEHGTPAKLGFSTTDHRPLQMEAH